MDSKKINQLGTEVDPQQSDLTVIGDPISGQLKKITWLQVAHLIGAQASVTLQQVTDNGNTTTDPITTGGLTLTNLGTGLPRLTSGEFVGTYGYGLANGVATLDSGGKIPASQLPSSVMEYKGLWNASTNTPTLADGTGDNGDVYLVSVAGSQNLGSGTISFAVGDWVVYNGTIWQKSLNSNAVASVFGRTGTIVAQEGDYNIDQLGDVAITSAATNDYLRYNGSSWVNTQFPTFVSSDKLVLQVRNNSGATINKGTVVYINGASAGYPTIAKAQANADATSAQTIGMVQDNISNNSNGVVVIVGQITGVDTSAYTAGTQLYLSGSTAGAVTSTKTLAPTHLVYVGIVTTQNAVNGVIEVKIQNGYELEEIHDVALSSPTNNQVLVYESATDLWKNKSISTILGGTPVTGSGTNNYIPKFTTTGSTIGDSVIYNDGASIRINTTAVHNNFTANLIVGSSGNANLEVRAATFDQASIQLTQGTSDSSTSPRVEIYNSGNFGIVVYKPSVVSSNFVLYYDTESATNRSLSFQTEGSDRLTLNQSGTIRMNNYTTNGFVKFSGGDGTLSVDTVSYLPLTGGTLTGGLSGTTGTFSGVVQASAIKLTNMTAGSGALYYNTGESRLTLANYNASGIIRFETNGGTNAGTINADQTWTFPAQINGTSASFTASVTTPAGFYVDANTYLYEGILRLTDLVGKKNILQLQASSSGHYITSTFLSGGSQQAIYLSAKSTAGQNVIFNTDGTTTFSHALSGTSATFSGLVTINTNDALRIDPSSGSSYMQYRIGGTPYAYTGVSGASNDIITGSALGDLTIRAGNNQKILFSTNNGGTAAMTITSGGNVGIGTSPSYKLDVYSSATSGAPLLANFQSAGGDTQVYVSNSTITTQLTADNTNGVSIVGSLSNHPLVIRTNNSERMRITSGGNVLFSNPNSGNSVSTGNITLMSTATAINDRLTIAFAQTGVSSRARAGIGSVSETTDGYLGALAFYTRAANDGSALDTSNERMRITSGGNVLIGTTSDQGRLTVANSACIVVVQSTTSTQFNGLEMKNGGGSFYFGQDNSSGTFYGSNAAYAGSLYMSGNYPMVFFTNQTERMRINSGGNVSIGNTANTYRLDVSLASGVNGQIIRMNRSAGAYGWGIGIDSANSNFNFYNNGGTSVANINNSTGAYTATSDARLKENIIDSESAIDKINLLKIRKYNWKNSGLQEEYGLIAQELYEILPQYVLKGNEENNWGVAKAEIVPFLVKAIQEQQAQIEELKSKLN